METVLLSASVVVSAVLLWMVWRLRRAERERAKLMVDHLKLHQERDAAWSRLVRKLETAAKHAELTRDEVAALRAELRRHATSNLLHPDREVTAQTERGT